MSEGLNFALVGDRVEYSKSPDIFSAIFNLLGRRGRFDIAPVNAASLRDSLDQLVSQGKSGISVTIPYKQSVLDCLDEIDPTAAQIGAVNCINANSRRLVGHNTDRRGFARSLSRMDRQKIGPKALVVGTGGGAKAVSHSLWCDFGLRSIDILGRDESRADAVRRSLAHALDKCDIGVVRVNDTITEREMGYPLVVNCTPLGGPNFPNKSPFDDRIPCATGGIYYDLNYSRPNLLVTQAREQGCMAIDGAPMLVLQALESFKIWTGIDVAFDDVYPYVFGKC